MADCECLLWNDGHGVLANDVGSFMAASKVLGEESVKEAGR